MSTRFTAALLLTCSLSAPTVGAHHSFAAEFDGSKPVTLKGTVTKMEWTNPHAWLHIDVKGPDGKVVSWMIEGGAPNALLRRGWNRTSVPPGTPIVVRADSPAEARVRTAMDEFRRLFPIAMCYARVVPVDEAVTLVLFHREDEHLERAMDRYCEEAHLVA